MARMIQLGSYLYRISPNDPHKIEMSNNGGFSWMVRWHGRPTVGAFMDIETDGKNIIGYTNLGVFIDSGTCTNFLRKHR